MAPQCREYIDYIPVSADSTVRPFVCLISAVEPEVGDRKELPWANGRGQGQGEEDEGGLGAPFRHSRVPPRPVSADDGPSPSLHCCCTSVPSAPRSSLSISDCALMAPSIPCRNGVLEVRKKGMWDETEEQRQKRLAGRKTMGEKVRGAMAAYVSAPPLPSHPLRLLFMFRIVSFRQRRQLIWGYTAVWH